MGDEALGDESFVVKQGSDGPEGGSTTSQTHIRSNEIWIVKPILLIRLVLWSEYSSIDRSGLSWMFWLIICFLFDDNLNILHFDDGLRGLDRFVLRTSWLGLGTG